LVGVGSGRWITGPVVVVVVGLGVDVAVGEVALVADPVVERGVEVVGVGVAAVRRADVVLDGEGVRVELREGAVGEVRGVAGVPEGVSTAPGRATSGSAVVAPAALVPDNMNGNATRAVRPPTQSSTNPGSGFTDPPRRDRRPWWRSTSRAYAASVTTAAAARIQSRTVARVVPAVRSARSTSQAHQTRAMPPTTATAIVSA
jgi:hypothetical protein